jgi:IclR family acetate operon transcriptional repressor
MHDARYSIRSVQRVCDILDLVQQRPDEFTLIDVAKATQPPKSSAFRYLATLEARGYIERTEAGNYTVGFALRSERLDVLSQRVRPYLRRLRDQFGETVNFSMLDGGQVVYLQIAESPHSTRTAPRPGERDAIHSTALGKVLTAWRPAEYVLEILRRTGMPRRTDNTITQPEAYLAELARVREHGYAVDDQENEPESRCIAVPIHGVRLPVALSMSAPAVRLGIEQVPRIAAELARAAADFAGVPDASASSPVSISGPQPGK